jgi:hypothetical protein
MITFTAIISKFGQQGEKTGWSYLEIPAEIAEQIKPGTRKGYRVKGKLDNYRIEQVSLLPMGEGNFIIPLNAAMRKAIKKNVGATVTLQLAEDKKEPELCPELVECLQDEPAALKNFQKLPPSHQRYYSKWILSAKTEQTKAKRIAKTIEGLIKNLTFGETMKS